MSLPVGLALGAALCAGLAVLVLPAAPRPRAPGATAGRGAGRRRGSPPVVDAALVLDLVAAVVESGAPPTSAVAAVARLLAEAGFAAGEQLDTPAELRTPLRRCLDLADRTGAPVAALLRSAADELRRQRRRRAALAAARLGVRVVLPLGLCTLPAFALLGVVPVLLSLGRGLLG